MHNKVITVFNLHNGKWHPTVIPNCYSYINRGISVTTNGMENSDNSLTIIYSSREKVIKTQDSEVTYITPKAYKALTDVDGYITFSPEEDFIYCGEWSGGEELDDDYDSGYYDYMNTNYDGILMVQNAVFYDLIPHFEVTTR